MSTKLKAETAKLAGLQIDLLSKLRSGKITLNQLEQFLNQKQIINTIYVNNINRKQTPMEAIKATGRNQFLNDEVVKNMPMCVEYGDNVSLEVFKPGKYQTPKQIDEWYEREGLVPDPIALLKHLEDNPEATDGKYLAVQWKNKDGSYCYLALDDWSGGRGVNVGQRSGDWTDNWSFVGLRKS